MSKVGGLLPQSVRKLEIQSSHHGTVETNLTSIHEVAGSTPGLVQWVEDPALYELWCRSQTLLGSSIAVAAV